MGDDAFAGLLAEHHRVIRSALDESGGREETTSGDGFFATFNSPRGALEAALTIQRGLANHAWPDAESVRVRIGLHTGEATRTETGLVGYDVHRAARIAAVGYGGQVLASASTASLLRNRLDDAFDFEDLGTHRLKDLGRPESIFQVTGPGLRSDFPPLRSLDNPELANNLPISLDPFIGRERDIDEVKAAFARSRLVTLTGSGGAGKTRLALQVAADMLDGTGEGVWLVEFAPLNDAAKVAGAILEAIGARSEPGEDSTSAVLRALRRQTVLVVLDNCEHVIDEAARLAELIGRQCAGVCLLATSREPLGIPGEEVIRVRSLDVPPEDARSASEICCFDAVDLFVSRARAHDRDFALSDEDAALAASICRHLDGIPLAIELAAARTSTMSLDDLHRRLDQRFRILTGGSRTSRPRQQTLAATVAWSYDLLSELEREVLQRLSVFADSFDLAAAESVCADEVLETFDIDEMVGALVHKSLVSMEKSDAHTRYRLLETIRQFGLERLIERSPGAAQDLRERHAAHYTQLAEEAHHGLFYGQTGAWIRRLGIEWGNLRAAAEFLLSSPGRAGDAQRLLGAIAIFLENTGRNDGMELTRVALEADPHTPARTRAYAMHCQAMWNANFNIESLVGAGAFESDLLRVAEVAREAEDVELETRALLTVANNRVLYHVGSTAELARRAEQFSGATSDPLILSHVLEIRAAHAREGHDWYEANPIADALADEALAKAREAGSMIDVCGLLVMKSIRETFTNSDPHDMIERTREILEIADEVGDLMAAATSRANLAWELAISGETTEALATLVGTHRWLMERPPAVWEGVIFGMIALTISFHTLGRGDAHTATLLAGAGSRRTHGEGAAGFSWSPHELVAYERLEGELREALGERFDEVFSKGAVMTSAELLPLIDPRRYTSSS